jgi:hypothetical protein
MDPMTWPVWLLIAAAESPMVAADRRPVIGFVEDGSTFDGAGCALWRAGDPAPGEKRRVFVGDFENRAAVHVDGRDRALLLIGSDEPKGELKKGRRSLYRYRGDGVEVVVRYVVTQVCAPDDESCEVVNYDAVVTVSTRSGTSTVQAHGVCGS